jgi:NAD(P)-dependent dehydrogenase (short-subunit alcohol dehydrogenase family)
MPTLTGKVAIVTGGARGLGAAVARGLAKRGAAVVINYVRSREDAVALEPELRALGGDGIAVRGDVSVDADCRQIARAAVERWGRIDILINNAATTTRMAAHDDLEALQADDFLATYRTNVIGAFQMIRACQPAMKAQGYGAVVNVSSVGAIRGTGTSVSYAASKGALNNMTLSLARALGPEIRVNAVCPGFMATRWFSDAFGQDGLNELIGRQKLATPLQRAGTPEDIATSVLFLADEGAMHNTGTILVCDAGLQLGPKPPALPRAKPAAKASQEPS